MRCGVAQDGVSARRTVRQGRVTHVRLPVPNPGPAARPAHGFERNAEASSLTIPGPGAGPAKAPWSEASPWGQRGRLFFQNLKLTLKQDSKLKAEFKLKSQTKV